MTLNWQHELGSAQRLAARGQSADCLERCRSLEGRCAQTADALLSIGSLLLQVGYLSDAERCFQRVCDLAPADPRPWVNRANRAREAGDHRLARRLYDGLLEQYPNHAVIRRNALTSAEYDPDTRPVERLERARAWGHWAVARAGGPHRPPVARASGNRPLRIGYVSADFCQHTVGLFFRPVVKAHDPERVHAFAYSAGTQQDWVTREIRAVTEFRPVADLDDNALAETIRNDRIDVLIDLSGHTAGSRLTVFARRPAPVQLSWLGYFATTGLATIDAVLLDPWHAPAGAEADYVEPIVRLASGRFCYQPVPWAPVVAESPPVSRKGFVTFGSFNNTAKLNDAVIDLWASILRDLPDARLRLKWRTFNDPQLCQALKARFAQADVAPERLELQPASFHADLLKEYAEIDIALDPFPFTGGLTSCEALYMGVPVVTWPGDRTVSRQTLAILGGMGLDRGSKRLVAADEEDYRRIAVQLAGEPDRLQWFRQHLRPTLAAARLMQPAAFTDELEGLIAALVRNVQGAR